jgi:hypothetical protein
MCYKIQYLMLYKVMQCRGSGGQSPTSKGGGPCSTAVRYMWDFWWTKWHLDTFLRLIRFYSVSVHPAMPHTHLLPEKQTIEAGEPSKEDMLCRMSGSYGRILLRCGFFVYGNNRCSQIHTIYINTLCGQNVELLNVKLMVHLVTTGLWRVNIHYTCSYRAVNTISFIKTSQLMLCKEIIAVFSQIHTKHRITLCGQNVELLNVKLVVHS